MYEAEECFQDKELAFARNVLISAGANLFQYTKDNQVLPQKQFAELQQAVSRLRDYAREKFTGNALEEYTEVGRKLEQAIKGAQTNPSEDFPYTLSLSD